MATWPVSRGWELGLDPSGPCALVNCAGVWALLGGSPGTVGLAGVGAGEGRGGESL